MRRKNFRLLSSADGAGLAPARWSGSCPACLRSLPTCPACEPYRFLGALSRRNSSAHSNTNPGGVSALRGLVSHERRKVVSLQHERVSTPSQKHSAPMRDMRAQSSHPPRPSQSGDLWPSPSLPERASPTRGPYSRVSEDPVRQSRCDRRPHRKLRNMPQGGGSSRRQAARSQLPRRHLPLRRRRARRVWPRQRPREA